MAKHDLDSLMAGLRADVLVYPGFWIPKLGNNE